jgi:hypothetical protein
VPQVTWWHVEPDRIVIRDQQGEVASIPREVWGLLICAMAEKMRRQDASPTP